MSYVCVLCTYVHMFVSKCVFMCVLCFYFCKCMCVVYVLCSCVSFVCIGIWNVRFMNQGKSEVVKQEMARVNVDILGISELKWTGMGEFNSHDHYIYYCGQESLRRME